MPEISTITMDDAVLKGSARKYSKELVKIPILTLKDQLPYFNIREGIRYQEVISQMKGKARLKPYKRSRQENADIHFEPRTLSTYLGNAVYDFDINDALDTIWGTVESQSKELKESELCKLIVSYLAEQMSLGLAENLFTAKRNAEGDDTKDLFDGFKTIGDAEILGGGLSAENHNLVSVEQAFGQENSVDIITDVTMKMAEELRHKNACMYMSDDNLLRYNHGYENVKGNLPYNKQFERFMVPGTNCKLISVPYMPDDLIIVSTKQNMRVGMATSGKKCRFDVKDSNNSQFALAFVASMFFGCQFGTLDPRELLYCKLGAGV